MTSELWAKVSDIRWISIRQDFERYPEADLHRERETVEETRERIKKRWADARRATS